MDIIKVIHLIDRSAANNTLIKKYLAANDEESVIACLDEQEEDLNEVRESLIDEKESVRGTTNANSCN